MTRNIALRPKSSAFMPFFEDWDSFSFEDQNWSFTPYQSNWITFPEEGNPSPSAGFLCDNTLASFSFALVSPEILLNKPDESVSFRFDLNILNNGATYFNTMSVDVWNQLYWISVDEFNDFTGSDWVTHSYDISEYIVWPSLKIRFVSSGEGGSDHISWLIDNITIHSEELNSFSGQLINVHGFPIPGGVVRVEGYEPVITDTLGYYSVEVSSGYYNVSAEAEGYYSDTIKGIYIGYYGLIFDIILEQIVSIPPDMNNSTFLVYPNPASSVINFKLPPASEKIIIYDIRGQVTYRSYTKGQLLVQTDFSGFGSGFYIVQCILSDGKIITKKIIIE